MEGYLRVGLLLIAGIVILLTIFETLRSKRRLKLAESKERNEPSVSSLFSSDILFDTTHFSQSAVLQPKAVEFFNKTQPVVLSEDEFQRAVEAEETPISIEPEPAMQKKPSESVNELDSLLVISVIAKPGCRFVSYELLQAITATGMRFGDMNIFHYYGDTIGELEEEEELEIHSRLNSPLFSLASATKPGYFDLDRMGDFSCTGLTLFMDLTTATHAQYAFEMMVSIAEQLADDLDGELRAGQKEPWNDSALKRYQEKILIASL